MIETLLQAVEDILEAAGLAVRRQYPAADLEALSGPVICLGIQSCQLQSSGAGEYLGLRLDAGTQTERELYGFRLEAVLALDIYGPRAQGAAGCLDCFGAMSAALDALPEGIRARALVCGGAEIDSVTELFHCGVQLHCQAYFLREKDGEDGQFTDFEIKGVVKHGGK